MVPVAPALRTGVRGWLQTMVERAENHSASRAHVCREAPITRAERTGAIRLGWNDAAWGRARRQIADQLERFYAIGYTGGLVFRRNVRSLNQ